MRYAQVRSMDITNGEGVGMALFVQGCPFHCIDCFNPETWDFGAGEPFEGVIKSDFYRLLKRPFIKRLSILGGEPLAQAYDVFCLINDVKAIRPDIKIWLYSGYTYEEIMQSREQTKAILNVDVLVDGRFETDKKDLNLKFRGSSNQRLIDVKESIKQNKVICIN